MSRESLANAYEGLAEAYAQVAHELRGSTDTPARVPSAPAPAARADSPSAPAPVNSIDTTKCPKHHVPWTSGNYGEFCRQQTDDPAWGKEKTDRDGNKVFWCRITPKNAPQWVAINAPTPTQDVDDLAF